MCGSGPGLTEIKLWPPVAPIKFSRREQFAPSLRQIAIVWVNIAKHVLSFPHYKHSRHRRGTEDLNKKHLLSDLTRKSVLSEDFVVR